MDMSKTVLANVEGFTPVIDDIVKDVGLMSAVVFGRMWRFCQMKDGVCNASLEKIAEEIGVDRATVMRHAKDLCAAGYLKDLTPDLRNHPHTYADTGKVMLRLNWGVAQNNNKITDVADSNTTVAQSNVTVAESKLKKDSKKDSKKVKEGASAKPKANTYPELVTFREVTKRYPHEVNWGEVIDAFLKINLRLGRDATRDDLLPFYKFWTGKGYNPLGLGWLEWAVRGETPQNGKVAEQWQNAPKGVSVAQSWLARKEQEAQNVRA
jgi:DNA-binding Lrp family transcriptional regulator